MDYFSQHIFSDPEKKTLDYSLRFLQNIDETMTAGYFLGGGGGGGGEWAVIIMYYIFQKIIHPQDPPTTGSHANIPPLQNIPRYECRRKLDRKKGHAFWLETEKKSSNSSKLGLHNNYYACVSVWCPH